MLAGRGRAWLGETVVGGAGWGSLVGRIVVGGECGRGCWLEESLAGELGREDESEKCGSGSPLNGLCAFVKRHVCIIVDRH